MAFQRKAKRFVKRVARRGVALAKKRYVKKGQPNIKNITNDVMMLKRLINVEKKKIDFNTTNPQGFAQTAGAGVNGYYSAQVTPIINQNVTGTGRTGNSLKLTGATLDFYFNHSVNCVNQIKIKWILFCKPDAQALAANLAVAELLEVNPFSGLYDYHSSRDLENYADYRIIKQGKVTLQPDSLTGQISYAQLKMPIKLNHHLKYNADGSTTTQRNQFYLVCLADTGDTTALTGCQVQYSIRYFYVDN